MKTAIHPPYYANAKVTCACGHTFTIGSTREDIQVELCSNCHPFYTGQQKLVDTARRVDKFQKRMEAQTTIGGIRKGKRVKIEARKSKRQLKAEEAKRVSKHKHTPTPSQAQ